MVTHPSPFFLIQRIGERQMPYIKLKQPKGQYNWNGRQYLAGEILEVTDKEAYYLVHTEKVAESVHEYEKEKLDKQAQIDKNFEEVKKSELKIALLRLGGIGDTFLLACHAKAIKRKFPNSVLTLFVRDEIKLINDFEAVDRVVFAGKADWIGLLEQLRSKGQYDLIFDNRYITKVYACGQVKDSKVSEFLENAERCFKPFKAFYQGWIQSSKDLAITKISTFDLFYKSTGLEGGEDDISIELRPEHFKFSQLLNGDKYVTIHNGSDVSRQTKCWPTSHWETLATKLKEKGYKVIQLGKEFEEKVESSNCLCGMTTLFESTALIANAKFHIDTEGGLVHLAKAVGTRAIVLFGPTDKTCFGYNQNINLATNIKCQGCWWSTDMWWKECPKGHNSPPPCMQGITPEMVMERVEVIEKMPKPEKKLIYDPNDVNEKFALELKLTEEHYRSQKHQWQRVNLMMDAVKGKTVLEVGAGDGYCSLELQKRGFTVTPTEISEIRLDRMRKAGLKPVKADIKKLPFADASFDSVICGEVLEHIPNWWEGMRELERVLKPEGTLILSWPIHPDYDGLQMHLWSIRQHIVERGGKPDLTVQVFNRIHR